MALELANIIKLADKLICANRTLSTAESCTGGGIGHLLTSISGSSAWYKGGIVAYSNELKSNLLHVPDSLINDYGAVSEQVAQSMAMGAAKVTNTDISISTTGIAGPEGGSENKPLGTVCFSWVLEGRVQTETIIFAGNRGSVREQAISHAINRLIEKL